MNFSNKEDPWIINVDFTAVLTPHPTDPQSFILKLAYLRPTYDITFRIKTVNIYGTDASGTANKFQNKYIKLALKKMEAENEIGISVSTQKAISKGTEVGSEFGQFILSSFPPVTAIIGVMNILKMISLAPVKYPVRFVQILKLFVTFVENDSYGVIPYSYSKEYIESKKFTPETEEFKFSMIYPRMRGLKIMIRFLTNVALLIYFGRSKQIEKVSQSKQGLAYKLKTFTIRLLVGMDHTNFALNLLLISISLINGASKIDIMVIGIDLLGLIFFQIIIGYIFLKYRNKNTHEIKSPVFVQLSLACFYLQKGNSL